MQRGEMGLGAGLEIQLSGPDLDHIDQSIATPLGPDQEVVMVNLRRMST